MPFLDTNIILRHLTQDNPDQSTRAYQLFQQLEAGTIRLTLTEGVLIEAVQVLSSKALYNLPRGQIRTLLTDIMTLRGVRLSSKGIYLRALELYASLVFLDFVDALLVARTERTQDSIYSFDRDFDRVPHVIRREP